MIAAASAWRPWADQLGAWRRSLRRPPLVSQMQRTDCGAACLTMVLAYHGHAAPLAEVRARCGFGRDGASAAALAAAAAEYRLRASAFRVTPAGLADLPWPAVLFVDGEHFVVLAGRGRAGWCVLDPARGRVRWSDAEMARRLSGVALSFVPAEGFERRRASHPGWGRYRAQLRPSGRAVALIALATAGLELAALVPPAALQRVVDEVIRAADRQALCAIAAAAVAAALGHALLLFARDRVIHRLHAALDVSLMSSFVLHLLRLPREEQMQRTAGDLMQRVQSNVALRDVAARLVTVSCDGLLLLGYAVLLGVYSPALATAVLLAHGLRLGLVRAGQDARSEAAAQEQVALGRERSAAAEVLAVPEFVRAWGLAEPLARRQRRRLRERVDASSRRQALAQRSALALQAYDGVAFALLLGGGAMAVATGALSPGRFAAFLAVAASMARPLQSLAALAGELAQLRGALARLDDVWSVPSPAPGGRLAQPLRGALELRGVRLRYGRHGPWVLDGVDLQVAAGEKVALVGASGAGKSTLLALALGILRPSEGQVLIDGRDLAALDRAALRDGVAAVLQQPFLFDGSARANLWLGGDPPGDERLHDAARQAQLHEVLAALPQGYETPIGAGARRLSAGQRQRLALARAFARRPALLVLDEATSHLDPETEAALQRRLDAMACTQLIAAHRLATVRRVDRIVVLQAGRIAQVGRFDELAAVAGPFRDLLEAGGRS